MPGAGGAGGVGAKEESVDRQLRGILSAMSTPFDANGALDEAGLRELTDGTIRAGVHGLITCGSTGEFPALTTDERKRVTEIVVDQAKGRVPVVAGTGSTSTAVAVDLTRHARGVGCDAVMVVNPYYEPMSLDEVYDYFKDVAEAGRLPIIVYNIPSCTGTNLPPAFVAKMAREIDEVQYVKDSSGDLGQVSELMYKYGDVITSFNGQDTITFSGLSLGAQGSVWGAANCMPRQCAELFDLCDAGRLNEAKALWDRMYPVQQFLVTEGYVASVKAGANLIGFHVGNPRKPFRPLRPDKVEELRGLLAVAGAIPEPARA